jgi:ribulose-phosphate 3-epimerase
MIIPALLTDDKHKLQQMLDICQDFCSYAQIDIMDGEFVPSRSITAGELSEVSSPIGCEAHLMVQDPFSWVEPFLKLNTDRIIFHYESPVNHLEFIDFLRQRNLGVGLAINPDTPLEAIKDLVDKIDMVLFMSVVPGFYGAKFIPQVLTKIESFRQQFPDCPVGIDGGIKLDNVIKAYQCGVKYICVGSALMKAPSPAAAYKQFKQKINE